MRIEVRSASPLGLGPASGSAKIAADVGPPTVYDKALKKPFKPETLSRGFCVFPRRPLDSGRFALQYYIRIDISVKLFLV